MPSPRVLYVTQGDSAHDRRFLGAMRQAEIEAAVVRLGGAPPRRALPDGVWDLSPRKTASTMRLARHLRGAHKEFQPSVVHAGPIQQGAFLAALSGIGPRISMSWGSDLLVGARAGVGRWKARWALSRSKLLLCDCQAVRSVALQLGMPEDRIVVFPWGVDLARFRPGKSSRIRRRLGWQDNWVLLSARSFEPLYGSDVIVDAFLKTAPRHRTLRLLLVASGSLLPAVERRIDDAGLRSRVHFAGEISETDLPDYYRAANVYLSASHSDGTSVSLLEAMACGLPALVTDIPSNREWVHAGQNGWLFPEGDSQALAEAIAETVVRQARSARMGSESRAKVEADADWRRSSRMLVDAYRMVSRYDRD